jgi:hypothetical protein
MFYLSAGLLQTISKSEKLGMMAYTCNLSYLGGRDQEDCSSKPAQAKSL